MDFGEDTELTVLKQNLQMPQTNANDEYLKMLLKQSCFPYDKRRDRR